MAENNQPTGLPPFESVQALTDFFDTHDMGDYLGSTAEAHFDVAIKRRQYLVAIDAEIMKKVATIAKTQQVSVETLINEWLQEQTLKAA